MEDLSLHVLDVVQNSLEAGADQVTITVEEEPEQDRLFLKIADNGRGLDAELATRVTDPFVTSRTTRKVGLGLALLAMAARQCDGEVAVNSRPGEGTAIEATFAWHHWDRPPLGDMAATLVSLVAGNPGLELLYRHRTPEGKFDLDTREIRQHLGEDIPLQHPEVLHWLRTYAAEGIRQLFGGEAG